MAQRNVDIISHLDADIKEVTFPFGIIPDSDLGQAESVFSVYVLEALDGFSGQIASPVGEASAVVAREARVGPPVDTQATDANLVSPGEDGGPSLDFSGLVQKSSLVNPQSPLVEFVGGGSLSFPVPTGGLSQGSVRSATPGADVLQAPDSAAFQWTTSLSVSFWMNPEDEVATMPLIGKGISSAGEAGWNIGMHWSSGASGTFWVEIEGSSGNSMGSSAYWDVINQFSQFRAGEWTHHLVVIDFSGTNPSCVIYSDGGAPAGGTGKTVVGSPWSLSAIDAVRNDNTQPFSLFGQSGFYFSNTYSEDVNMVDVALYLDKVLVQSDAQAIYNGGNLVNPLSATTSQSPDIYYSLRNTSTGLVDILGNAPSLVNSGCVNDPSFP